MNKTLNLHVTTKTYLSMLKLAKAENLTLDAWLTMQAERAVEVLAEAAEIEEDVGMRPAGDESEKRLDKGQADVV